MIAVARCFAQPNFKVCIPVERLFAGMLYLAVYKLNSTFWVKVETEHSVFVFKFYPKVIARAS